jgi:uncharacterized protein (TIGR00288 family)
MANYLYVDNSNLWIEGMRLNSASRGGSLDLEAAQDSDSTDGNWRIDFGRLYEFALENHSEVGRAVLYGSRSPTNDSLWNAAKNKGFEVIVHDRNIMNKEKQVDISMAVDIIADSFALMEIGRDVVLIITGDADFLPVVRNLRSRGFTVYIVFWSHAAQALKDSASKFINLDPYIEELQC